MTFLNMASIFCFVAQTDAKVKDVVLQIDFAFVRDCLAGPSSPNKDLLKLVISSAVHVHGGAGGIVQRDQQSKTELIATVQHLSKIGSSPPSVDDVRFENKSTDDGKDFIQSTDYSRDSRRHGC